MGIPYTESGYNMYDMLSVLQKTVRRGDYDLGGWGCQQLKRTYRSVMWNRMLITSCEDCYGVLTKEIVALHEKDMAFKDDRYAECAMALLCKARKSRDACYFACNFVIDSRKPREISYSQRQADEYMMRISNIRNHTVSYDQFGFEQQELFSKPVEEVEPFNRMHLFGLCLEIAIEHRDMDMMGWHIDQLRKIDWNYLWDVYTDYAQTHFDGKLVNEIKALREADNIFNRNKEKGKKNEIFISKAAMIFCYSEDKGIDDPRSSEMIQYDKLIDWSEIKVKPFADCQLKNGRIPDFVYDCHTLKGKKMGKTDWDMTRDEQEALYPLYRAYFDDASWIYTYEQDYRNGVMNDRSMAPIREFAKTHPANPVEPYPY